MNPSSQQSVTIARDVCIGSGNCLFYAPATFDLDDEDRAVIVNSAGDAPGRLRDAVDNCPSAALSFVDDEVG